MNECKVCANIDNDYCFACDNGSQFKPITNADRIRQMTDEELATFIANGIPKEVCNGDCNNEVYPCHLCVLEWLKWGAET